MSGGPAARTSARGYDLLAGVVALVCIGTAFLAVAPWLWVQMPNTAGEEGALLGAWRVRQGGNPYPTDPSAGAMAIYGPVFYALLGIVGAAADLSVDQLLGFGRAVALTSAVCTAVLLGAYAVRATGAPAAAPLALVPLALLPADGLRFLVSARPDAPALLLSMLGILLLREGRRRNLIAGGVCYLVALGFKPTAVAAPLAAIAALWLTGRIRVALLLAGGLALAGSAAAFGLEFLIGGGFVANLAAASAAPRRWEYLAGLFVENPAWWALCGLALLCAVQDSPLLNLVVQRSALRGESQFAPLPAGRDVTGPSAKAGGKAALCSTAIGVYALTSLAVAAVFSTRQGGDVNYLLEPAAATGLWLSRVAAQMWTRRTAGSAVWGAAIFGTAFATLMVTGRPDEISAARRGAAQDAAFAPLRRELIAWIRALPPPILAQENWLSYAAEVDGFYVDRIAYTSLALGSAAGDRLASERVARREFETIVLYGRVEDAGRTIYQDIPYATDALRCAISEYYECGSERYGWVAYHPRRGGAGAASSPSSKP